MDAFSFDWVLLRSFLGIYRSGTVAAAARGLSLQQSTLSRHLAELEAHLGEALFERTGRGLQATAAASVVAQYAAQIESTVNTMTLALTAKASTLTGTVRISANQTFSTYLLPPIIDELLGLHPGLLLELVVADDVPSLLNRATDIALRLDAPEALNLVARKVGEVSVIAVAHVDYLQQMGTPLQAADLLHHQLLGIGKEPAAIQALQRLGVDARKEHFRLCTNDAVANLKLLESAVGIGFADHFLLEANPDLRQVLPSITLSKSPCWLTTHSEISSNPLIRIVYDKLAERLAHKLCAISFNTLTRSSTILPASSTG